MAQQPKDTDAVLGGRNTPQRGLVLGGIQGVKQRLQAPNEEARAEALYQALNYGEEGLALIIASLEDESLRVNSTAYELLLKQPNPSQKLKVAIDDYQKLPPMVYIPRGSFLMGAPKTEKYSLAYSLDWERPQHRVEIAPFYMGRYPVTQAQYKAVMEENRSYFKGENNPVEKVSWHQAKEFCQKLSEQTGKTYQLPSEAQWEYACRAGTTTPFYFGETISTDQANYNGKRTYGNVYRGETTPVGSFPPNAFGLYDMHGNVCEWCLDNWRNSYVGAPTDGTPRLNGNHKEKVLRGGSWNAHPGFCRSACRNHILQISLYNFIGFRVICGVTRTL